MNNLKILELASYEAPTISESKRHNWVEYGDNNLYYEWLIERYRNSPTHNAVVNNISRLVYGKGLHATNSSRKANDYASFRTIISKDCLRKVALDTKLFGTPSFQVHYDEKHTKIVKAFHMPTNLIRPEKCNKDGEIEGYYYSDDWSDTKKYEPTRYPAFGTSKEQIEILQVGSYSVGMKYFSELDYQGGLAYTVLEEEISDYLINEVQNGFSGTKVVNFNNGVPTEEQQEIISTKVKSKLTGSRGQKVIVAFNNNAESKTTVDDIPLNDAPQHYEYLSNEAKQKILVAHNVVSPMLVGVVTENQGFSSNADEIEVASKYFYNIAIKPLQELIIDCVDKILAFNSISLDLYFKRLNLLEDLEQKEQEQEQQLSFKSELESVLEELGEDKEQEGWIVIDERDVELEDETILNNHLNEINEEISTKLNEETVLSKLMNFVSTGIARPTARSRQDKLVGLKFFKVRYEYTGNKNPEREFCKAMMSSNKVYRREDIDRMSDLPVNKGFGERGASTYDIFKFKGGARCHHKWKRVTMMIDLDKDSSEFKKIGTRAAEIKGFKVTNPFEVSIYPNNLPLKGFSPNNPNLPSDV